MSISDHTLRVADDLRAQLEQVVDSQARDIVAAWAHAWDEVAPTLELALQDLTTSAAGGRLSRAATIRSERLQRALRVIAEQLSTLAADAGVLIVGDLLQVIIDAGQAQHALIATQLPPAGQHLAVSWSQVDPDAISAIVRRSTERIHKLTRPLSDDAVRVMKRELIRGVAVGDNPRAVARRMLTRTEGAFNGGAARALTIARTEMLDAHRAAAQVAMDANADVLAGWVWTAQLGSRTCPACFGMHGSLHPLDEPGPQGHQNCRCARTPQTKSWRDLGFDIPQPRSVLPDGERTFRDMPAADQVAVLGRARYDAWRSGDLPMSRWAVKQSNDGWRDSYVPVKPPRSVRLVS